MKKRKFELDIRNFIEKSSDIYIVKESDYYIEFNLKDVACGGETWGIFDVDENELRLNECINFSYILKNHKPARLETSCEDYGSCIKVHSISEFIKVYNEMKRVIPILQEAKKKLLNEVRLNNMEQDFV